jgi:hypothetical protein
MHQRLLLLMNSSRTDAENSRTDAQMDVLPQAQVVRYAHQPIFERKIAAKACCASINISA